MKEIINVNNQQYIIETTSQLTQDQRNDVIQQLSKKIISQTISLGSGTCTPSVPLIKGKTRTVRCTASSTNPNPTFTYTLTVSGVPYTYTGTETTHDFTVTFPNTSSSNITLSVSDDCSGGLPDTATCTATLVDAIVTNFTVTPSSCTTQIGGGTPCVLTAGNCTDQSSNAMICTSATWSVIPGSGTIQITPSLLNCSVIGTSVGSSIVRCVIGTKTIDTPITVTSAACSTPNCNFTIV